MYKLIEFLKMMGNPQEELHSDKHAKYFVRFLKLLPARLSSHDSTRMTIAFFAVCGLDVLERLHTLSDEMKKEIIEWVYSYQIVPSKSGPKTGGFVGSSTLNIANSDENCGTHRYKWGHLAMTYTGIAILVTLGDDLSRLNRKAIVEGVAAVQRSDGSFSATIEGSEHDMRFVYCATAICAMINDWGDVNKKTLAQYIRNSLRYDYGVSQHFEMESHGGTTYCAIAALNLTDQLSILSQKEIEKIKRWLVFRQVDGFNGRPNKPVDTCYSFWIGATLKILGGFELTDYKENRSYVMSTQNIVVGGFGKWTGATADPFHSYFSLCGLSFINEPGLGEIMPSLNISMRAYNQLKARHKVWQLENNFDEIRLNID